MKTTTTRTTSWCLALCSIAILGSISVLACGSDGSSGSGSASVTNSVPGCGCAAGTTNCCTVTLTPSASTQTLAVPIIAPGSGKQEFTGYVIDATAFDSGTIVVTGEVGGSGCGASLDLFPDGTTYPTEGTPSGELANCYNNSVGKSFSMSHAFTSPTTFNLGLDGTYGDAVGSTNTVSLTITVTTAAPASDSCGTGSGGGGGSSSSGGCHSDSECSGECPRCSSGHCDVGYVSSVSGECVY